MQRSTTTRRLGSFKTLCCEARLKWSSEIMCTKLSCRSYFVARSIFANTVSPPVW